MNVVGIARLAVQSINVLGDQPFIGQPMMHVIWYHISIGCEPSKIPQQKFVWGVQIHRARCHILGCVIDAAHCPKSILPAKGWNAAFCADACACDVNCAHPRGSFIAVSLCDFIKLN